MKWNEKIKKLRGEKTIGEVAKIMCISPNTYEAYEQGNRIPLDPVKKIIADYFKMNISDIWK